MQTTIVDAPGSRALAAFVKHFITASRPAQWRHTGLGLLQAYVTEGEGYECRIHVWDRELVKPGIEVSGNIHDHRFNMRATVLFGHIEHTELAFRFDTDDKDFTPSHEVFHVTPARHAMTEYGRFDSELQRLGACELETSVKHVIREGQAYHFPARQFHFAKSAGLAVTVVEKYEQRGTARIIAPLGIVPVHAFEIEDTPGKPQLLLNAAAALARRWL